MTSPDTAMEIFFFVLGACFGSFANVVALRFPAGESIVSPGSSCPECQKPVRFYDNIPILSFFILRGRCRCCKKAISWQYPVVEFMAGVLFLAAYLKLGLSWRLVEILLFSWAGLVSVVIDYHHRILPDVFTLSGIVIGLVGGALVPERTLMSSIAGVLGGGGFLWMVAAVYSFLKKEEGMGGGDIKFIAWVGAVFGWEAVIFTILSSSIIGSVFGLIWAAIQRSGMKTAIPFGPFLFIGALLYFYFGGAFMTAYMNLFFPV